MCRMLSLLKIKWTKIVDRITVTLSCPMMLHKYPLDTQICSMYLESYAYTLEKMVFKWVPTGGITIKKGLEIPQFRLLYTEEEDCSVSYGSTGSFPCLQANFILRRDRGYYIIQIYIPTILVVILSWVSFWLNIDAIPARISLGVLTVLTMTTQSSSVRQSLPRVSYIKAIDVWMAMCLVFVFASLLEFAIVNVMSRRTARVRAPTMRLKVLSKETEQFMNNADGPADQNRQTDSVGKRQARDVDKASRKLFPLAFLVFNAIYWMIYLLWDNKNKLK